jgi:hypothetical protein
LKGKTILGKTINDFLLMFAKVKGKCHARIWRHLFQIEHCAGLKKDSLRA